MRVTKSSEPARAEDGSAQGTGYMCPTRQLALVCNQGQDEAANVFELREISSDKGSPRVETNQQHSTWTFKSIAAWDSSPKVQE